MKRLFTIFYFCVLQFVLFVSAQNHPNITPLENGLFFPNLRLEEERSIVLSTNGNCALSNKSFKKFYSYRAIATTDFAFKLESTNQNFNFHVWKLPVGHDPSSIFTRNNSTIMPNRMLYSTANVKGLSMENSMLCEFYGSQNFVRSFYSNSVINDNLKEGETIVIVVTGDNNTDTFDLTLQTVPQYTINYSGNCLGNRYDAEVVKQDIRNETGFNDVKLYTDFTLSEYTYPTIDNPVQLIGLVRDSDGNVKAIYTINFSYADSYQFYFTQNNLVRCGNQYIVDYNEIIRTQVLNFNRVEDFEIDYVEHRGIRYYQGDLIELDSYYDHLFARIRYVGAATCSNFTDMIFSISNVKSIIHFSPVITICGNGFTINMENLRLETQVINTDYELKLFLPNGTELRDGNVINLQENELIITTKSVHIETGCISESNTITIQKIPEIPIRNAELSICLVDLTQELINQKLDEIKNGVSGGFTYYFNGNQIQENQILSIIQNNLNGIIEVKVGDGCSVTKEFRFNLSTSSVRVANSVKTEELFCLLPTDVTNFNTRQLKEIALSNILNSANLSAYTFRFLDENGNEITSLSDVQDGRRVEVLLKLNSESCWQSFFILFNRVNRLVIPDSSRIITASCDDTIILTSTLLTELFGSEVLNYRTNLALNSPISIDFRIGNEVSLSIDFFINENCVTTKEIVVRKGTALNVDVSVIQQEILNNPFRFCDSVNVQELSVYLQSCINQIIAQYPNLRTEESLNFYTDQMTRNNGSVDVIFIDPNSCGRLSMRFTYRANPSPVLNLVDEVFTCTGIKYQLDLSAYLNPKIINENGQEVIGINSIFQLDLGRYTVSVYNEYGCEVSKIFTVANSPLPIIQEIVLNTDTITVLAIGNGGVLEYSLDGRNWQSGNKFYGIQKGTSYTVYVRENGCAIQSIANVVYLNLPNFVSPNGDGINDIWKPIGANSSLNVRIQVFNRYGKVVYTAEGENALNWNGKINSRPLPSDSYWYFIEYIDDSTLIKLKYQGYITIKSY